MTTVALVGGKILGSGGYIFNVGSSSPQVATPTFSPAAGSYSSAQTVTISCATGSSTIYYTTDGSTPTTGSTVYGSPITVSVTETVQAIATASGYTQSAVGSAAYTITSGATQVFNYTDFSGSPSAINVFGNAVYASNAIQIANGSLSNHAADGAWYKTQQNVSAFTTVFTFQITAPGETPSTQGFTFAVQNSVAPPGSAGYVGIDSIADANGCGYGAYNLEGQTPIYNSVGMKFDLSGNGVSEAIPSSTPKPSNTGLYINGGPYSSLTGCNDLQPTGIDLYSGHVFQVTIVYDGSLWTAVILDTSTSAQARYVWPVNVTATLSSNGGVSATNNAWPGFTSGYVSIASTDLEKILSWSFYEGYNTRLATPTFSVASGEYASTQTVSISYPGGSTCYYTTNGLLPTSASTQYTGPITVSANQVIQAVAIESGFTDSFIATASYWIGTGNIINFPSGFSAGDGVVLCGNAVLNGSSIAVVSAGNSHQASGAAWWGAPVSVSSGWSTTFTMQVTSDSDSTANHGLCFVIQNLLAATASPGNNIYISGGPTTFAGAGTSMGYGPIPAGTGTGTTGGILNSLAITLNPGSNGTGLYTNGVAPTSSDTTISGITLNSGHLIQATISYSGTSLTVALEDMTTLATFSHTFTGVNIPSDVGASTAYVGFTAGNNSGANIDVTNWTYT